MRSSSSWLIALAAATLAALPVACATAVDTNPSGTGTGSDPGGAGGQGGDGGGAVADAGADAPSIACTTAGDCAALEDICNLANCINGSCVQAPANEFGSCNDGNFCTENDVCQAGACVGGTQKPCPSSDSCHIGYCNEATDHCDVLPGNDGAACDDEAPCTGLGTCSGGACLAGSPLDCSFYDGTCTVGVCDDQLGCVPQPVGDGTPCSDGLFCTLNDTCTSGACGGEPNICAAPGDVCLMGSCNEATDSCTAAPGPNGVACNDNNLCTAGETCNAGACNGGAPANQGGACDDGNACTGFDACQNGACAGTPIVSCANGDGCCPVGCTLAQDDDCNALSNPSYDASQTFQDALQSTTMTLAWDGASFWSTSGGGPDGFRLAQYSAAGTLLGTYQPNIDFRSVFTKPDGTAPVFAREYGVNQIRVQTSPGVFGQSVPLSGGALDGQAAVVWDADASQFVAFNGGTVTRWTAAGSFTGTVTLSGYGNQNGEGQYPQNRGIIYRGGYYVTYSNGVLSGWNPAGQRVKQTTLNGAGTGFDSHFSLSYGAGKVSIIDGAGGTWRGYAVGL